MGTAIRESLGVFHDFASLRGAADELMLAGFDRAQLNLLGPPREVAAAFQNAEVPVRALEDDPGAPRQSYVGSDSLVEAEAGLVAIPLYIGAVAAGGSAAIGGGTIASAFGWAAVGAAVGAAIGALFSLYVRRRNSERLKSHIERGGLPLWVNVATPDDERKACEILTRCGADDVHVHELPVGASFARDGGGCDCGYLDRLFGGRKSAAQSSRRQ